MKRLRIQNVDLRDKMLDFIVWYRSKNVCLYQTMQKDMYNSPLHSGLTETASTESDDSSCQRAARIMEK